MSEMPEHDISPESKAPTSPNAVPPSPVSPVHGRYRAWAVLAVLAILVIGGLYWYGNNPRTKQEPLDIFTACCNSPKPPIVGEYAIDDSAILKFSEPVFVAVSISTSSPRLYVFTNVERLDLAPLLLPRTETEISFVGMREADENETLFDADRLSREFNIDKSSIVGTRLFWLEGIEVDALQSPDEGLSIVPRAIDDILEDVSDKDIPFVFLEPFAVLSRYARNCLDGAIGPDRSARIEDGTIAPVRSDLRALLECNEIIPSPEEEFDALSLPARECIVSKLGERRVNELFIEGAFTTDEEGILVEACELL